MRSIKKQHQPLHETIEGLITYRAMPTDSLKYIDPFLFLNHHGPQEYPPHNQGLPFGPHPHRGFETVTYILNGDIVHQDTNGFKSIIQAGGIQWMTAGKGLLHSESSSDMFKEKGGIVEVIQIWLNLPAKLKMTEPQYIGLQKDDIPSLVYNGGKVIINLVSGAWDTTNGPVVSLTNIHMSSIEFKSGGLLTTDIDSSHNILFYVVHGEIKVNNEIVTQHILVEFNNDGETLQMEALDDTLLLLGHGKPFNEPVVSRGPFVMNTEAEIFQAVSDYQTGKMGQWSEE